MIRRRRNQQKQLDNLVEGIGIIQYLASFFRNQSNIPASGVVKRAKVFR